MAAIKALERWCRLRCDGYRGVSISNMSGSFRDGLAFCALIHSHRPELIDYDSLDKDDVFGNNNLAFRVAEEKLGIPALLDAEDMVALRIPDRLSVLTYVSQYYNYFNGRPAVGGVKRPAEGSKEELSQRRNPPAVAKTFVSKTAAENRAPPARVAETSPKLARVALQAAVVPENAGKTGTLNSKCVACQEHVHLVQRHFVEGKLYHRSCFKCSECSALLHSAAFTVGKEPGTFVCRARHQNKQSGSEPFSSGAASNSGVALQPVRGSNLDGPARRGVSVLEAPSDPVLKRDEPPHVSRSWTVSAQKTQEARRRFFQAAAPGDDGKKTPAPSNVNVPGKQSERPASFGDGAGTATTGKLAEKNCNNNNTAKFTIRSAKRRFGDEPNASDVPGFRQDKTAQGPAAGSRTGHPSTQTNNTESSRRLKAVHGAARPASPRPAAQDPMCQDWRSRLKPVKTGPGLSSPEADTQQRGPQPPSENPPISSFSASRCPAVPTSAAFTAPSPPQPTRRDPQTAPKHQPSAGNKGAKKGKYLSSDASRSETRSAAIQCPQVPADQIVKELNGIEAELGVLEREGVELEKRLRSFEEEGGGGDILMDPLMVDWFNLIRKKQMYIRKESELVYIARTQDLERQQPGVEGELRRLLEKPDNLKTAAERQRQQMLMERLVEIVNGRNAIVEGLDEDRLREVEEDQQLNKMMQNLAVKKKRKSSISKLFRRRSRRAVE